ncbi:MAG: hypothetical protein GY820_20540, partial [Gammaproteobacteria bacterium]|nr:hypothetical protein [Gammaproteobacteria bacterium]
GRLWGGAGRARAGGLRGPGGCGRPLVGGGGGGRGEVGGGWGGRGGGPGGFGAVRRCGAWRVEEGGAESVGGPQHGLGQALPSETGKLPPPPRMLRRPSKDGIFRSLKKHNFGPLLLIDNWPDRETKSHQILSRATTYPKLIQIGFAQIWLCL